MKRILITGGAGFIGSHFTRALLDQGAEVTVLDNLHTGNRKNLAEFEDHPLFTFVEHDITEPYEQTVDEVYHLACPASPVHYQAEPLKTLTTAVLGVRNILELARKCGAKVLHASTSEVYGDPLSNPQREQDWGNVNPIGVRACYDEGKRVGETFCADYRRVHQLDVRVVRIFNTYGPNMDPNDGRVVSNLIVQALKAEPLTIYGDGSQTRSFQYVSDLVSGLLAYMAIDKMELAQKLEAHHWTGLPVLNIGNPDEFTINELASEIRKNLPSATETEYHVLPSDDPKQRCPDITLAKAVLGWSPEVPLAEGLKRTITYFKARLGE